MKGEKMPCGHPVGWMLRLRDGPKLYKYCWGCIIDKIGIDEVYADKKQVKTDKPKTISKTEVKKQLKKEE